MESLDKLNENKNTLDKKIDENLVQNHKIRSNSSLEIKSNYKIFEPISTETKQDFSNEITEFFQQIFQLRRSLDLNKKQNAKVIVYSPIVDFELSKFKNLNIHLNIRYYSCTDISKRYLPLRILVSFNSNIETILYHVLNLYKIEELDVSKYFLKIHGLEEYLPLNACIAELKYFYDCMNENKEPVLILVSVQNFSTPNNELNKIVEKQLQHSFSFDNLNIYFIVKTKIEYVLRKIVDCKNELQELLKDEKEIEKLDRILDQLNKLIQNIHFLKSLLFEIGHDLIELDIFKLNLCLNKLNHLLNINFTNEKEPLISRNIDYTYSISSSSDYLRIDLTNSLNFLLEKICNDVHSFVKCAYQSFYSDFNFEIISGLLSVKSNKKNGKTLEIIQADSKLVIYFKGISRLENLVNKFSSTIK